MRFLSNLIASTLGALLAVVLLFFLGFLLILGLAATTDQAPSVRSGSVLVINLDGPIPEVMANDPFMQAFGGGPEYDLRDLQHGLRKAAADSRIEAVWIQVQSVSGSWATLEEVRSALQQFRTESGKPIFASSDDFTVSETGYYVASIADSVFAQEEGIFEFNGFAIIQPFFANALDRLGVETQVVKAGSFKTAAEQFTNSELSAPNREQLDEILSNINTRFMTALSESRGMTVDRLRELASDDVIFTADGALEAGLIDALVYRDEVEALLKSRTGLDEDDDLRTVTLGKYARVPDEDAGLDIGGDSEIAIVYATGQIVNGDGEDDDPFSTTDNLEPGSFRDAIRKARDDDDVRAVVVRVSSPGGSASASEAIAREIALTQEVKPVIISMGDVAASGGYWIATPAEAIVADPLTLTGSIGVIGLFFNTRDFFNDKLGVTFDGVQTSPYADMFSGIDRFEEGERQVVERFIDETYQSFLQRVSQARGLSVEEVDSIAQGRVWTGMRALDLGLVDELGGLPEALALAAERAGLAADSYDVRILPRPKSFFEQLSSSLEARAAHVWLGLTSTPEERMMMKHSDLLRQLKAMHGTPQARMPFGITVR